VLQPSPFTEVCLLREFEGWSFCTFADSRCSVLLQANYRKSRESAS